MKVAFGTVVYKMAYAFHEDFINAINHQDTINFDILLLNDHLDAEKCNHLTNHIKQKAVWVKCKANKTISELKLELIQSAKEKEYDLLIFGDFDDVFSENRISKNISNFDSKYSFFYNELYYFDKEKKFFGWLPPVVEDINPILECNFLGFSNTALNLNKIDYQLLNSLKAKQTIAFDWMLFSLLLLQGHKGKKIEDCRTYYRIYEHNIAGETHIGIEGLKKEIEIKVAHYSKLADIDSRYCGLYNFYAGLKDSFETDLLLEKSTINKSYWWGRINKNIFLREGQ